jgi:uncharacterized protein
MPVSSIFALTLMVNHACNLRCSYCYTGAKVQRPMPLEIALRAVDRALAAVSDGGKLSLGFFGGEPLIEAATILRVISYATDAARARRIHVELALTTNGTITTEDAWAVMRHPNLSLSVSCDGLPEVHDRHRKDRRGEGSASAVLATLKTLIAEDSGDRRVVA